jgi:FkbM family methyltransferase
MDDRSFYRLAGDHVDALFARTRHGLVAVPTRDPVIGERTVAEGGFEEATAQRVAQTLDELDRSIAGRDVLEVGANVGTQTIAFLRTYGARRVVALEPVSAVARLLAATVAVNDLQDRVTLVRAAASDRDGRVRMQHNPGNVGDHRVDVGGGAGTMGEEAWEGEDVAALRLDGLLDDGRVDPDRLGLLWIDAQGHEGQVLAGAPRLLDLGVPVVTEFWPYGLRRAGGLEMLAGTVAGAAARVVDLDTGEDVPPRDLLAHAARVSARAATDDAAFTDLLLLP